MSAPQLFLIGSTYGAMTAAAAIDAGLVPEGERILIAANVARMPEASEDFFDLPHVQPLLSRFDRIEYLNELVAPRIPTGWTPRPEEWPVLERLLRRAWNLGDGPVGLHLQSVQVAPSRTIANIFVGAPISVIGDGLMSYSPIRDRLRRELAGRVTRVMYADVVPGVTPTLFTEEEADLAPIAVDAFRKILDGVIADVVDPALDALDDGTSTALVLGQYLADLGILTELEEQVQQQQMIDRAAASGADRVVFKPHPGALPSALVPLIEHAQRRGIRLDVHRGPALAEAVAVRLNARSVVAGFSTALPTLQTVYGIPIEAIGTGMLLQRLDPFENSNRIPVVIIDALTRAEAPQYQDADVLQELVDTVAYCMQPMIVRQLRPRAEAFLAAVPQSERLRYVGGRRLSELNLPGAAKRTLWTGGYSYLEQGKLTVAGVRRRAERAWKVFRGI